MLTFEKESVVEYYCGNTNKGVGAEILENSVKYDQYVIIYCWIFYINNISLQLGPTPILKYTLSIRVDTLGLLEVNDFRIRYSCIIGSNLLQKHTIASTIKMHSSILVKL